MEENSSGERPQAMEFVRAEPVTQTGRVAAVRVDETQLATIVREEAPLPPLYQFLLKLADQLGDIVGCAILAWLCSLGKLGGDNAAMAILALLGVNNGVRQLGSKARGAATSAATKIPPGLGAITLGLAFLGTAASHFFRAHSGTHAGFARVRTMRLVALATVLVCAAAIAGCASNSNGMGRAMDGYETFQTWTQRICGVLTALPSPPTVRTFLGAMDAGIPLDAGVP